MNVKFLYRRAMTAIGCLLLFAGLGGCNDDSLDGSLSFSDDNLLLKAAGDTVVIDVAAGSDWSAESQADWCTVEKETAEKLVVRVAPSDDVYERGTAVKVVCGDNVVRLAIRQEPMVFEISEGKKTLNFNKGEATDVLNIRTNMSWKVEIADTTGWLRVADTAGSGDRELVFLVSDNSQKEERATTVRLRYGVRSLKLKATQEGGIRLDGHFVQHSGNRDVKNGYNLVFLGEGFTKEDLISETGAFDKAVEEACEALFGVEPYKTYKDYFNVFSVACVSKERGVTTVENGGSEEEEILAKQTAFEVAYHPSLYRYQPLRSKVWPYAKRVPGMDDNVLKNNTCVVLLVNDERYGGNTYWYSDGRTLSVVPLNRDAELPGGFTNLFLHEVGGHGIGKLGDEWSTDVTLSAEELLKIFNWKKSFYCLNLGLPTNIAFITYPTWSFPILNVYTPSYTVKSYDGGFGCKSSTDKTVKNYIVHCEECSCMLDHYPYFNVTSRYGIVSNILKKTGTDEAEINDYFIAHDAYEVPEWETLTDYPRLSMPTWVEIAD